MTRARFCRSFAIVSLSACLSGCVSGLLPEPAPAKTVYRLSDAIKGQAVAASSSAIVMRVDRPTVPRSLVGSNIAVSLGDNRILSASGAVWSEKIPDLIQGSIMDIFSARPEIVGVLPVSGARTELRLHIHVRNFEAQYDRGEGSAPLAVVRYSATLANASDRDLIGTYDIRKTQRAASNRIGEIVRAHDLANAAAINDIADWIARSHAKSAPS
jgi:ABC-type uncharacterized transport system auxiliary subunit